MQFCVVIIKTVIMKRFFQTTLFIVVLSAVAIYSKTISREIIDSYNGCIHFIANHTVGDSVILGI